MSYLVSVAMVAAVTSSLTLAHLTSVTFETPVTLGCPTNKIDFKNAFSKICLNSFPLVISQHKLEDILDSLPGFVGMVADIRVWVWDS